LDKHNQFINDKIEIHLWLGKHKKIFAAKKLFLAFLETISNN